MDRLGAHAFDLWIGEWDVDVDGGHAVNTVGPGFDGRVMAERFAGRVDTDRCFKRTVFSDITDDSFEWRWESSPDGEAWSRNWAISYRRRA